VLAALLSALLAGAEQEGEHKSYQHRPEREALRDSERDPEEGGDGADDHVSSLAAQVKGATALPLVPLAWASSSPATFSLMAGDEFVPPFVPISADLRRSQPTSEGLPMRFLPRHDGAVPTFKTGEVWSPRLGRFDSCADPFL
jgi:hypothetical protein